MTTPTSTCSRAPARTPRSATQLEELAHFFPDRQRLVDALHSRALESDARTVKIVARASATFVTPLEREDIVALATDLDELVRAMHGTAALLQVYGIEQVRDQARRQTQLIAAATSELSAAVALLRRAEDVSTHTHEIRQHVEQGDDITRSGLLELFQENPPPVELVRWKDLYERLQSTLGLLRRAAARVEGIAAQTS